MAPTYLIHEEGRRDQPGVRYHVFFTPGPEGGFSLEAYAPTVEEPNGKRISRQHFSFVTAAIAAGDAYLDSMAEAA